MSLVVNLGVMAYAGCKKVYNNLYDKVHDNLYNNLYDNVYDKDPETGDPPREHAVRLGNSRCA